MGNRNSKKTETKDMETNDTEPSPTPEYIRSDKVLLLGTASSGKSTVFKQLNRLWSNNETPWDNESQIKYIRENIVDGLSRILMKSYDLYNQDPIKYKTCNPIPELEYLTDNNPELFEYVKNVVRIREEFSDLRIDQVYDLNLGPYILPIFKLNFVQESYKYRFRTYSYNGNIEYFFENANKIFQRDYIASYDDILRSRVRTSGLVRTILEIPKNEIDMESDDICVKYEVWDAGGTRNERSKWIHQFEGVNIVVFVASLEHYCKVLFEDEYANAMHESIKCFEQTVNLEYFESSKVILLLTGYDIFRERIKSGINLDIGFTNHPNWTDPNYQWNINDNYSPNISTPNPNNNIIIEGYIRQYLNKYVPVDIIQIINSFYDISLDHCYHESIQFIKNIYISRYNKLLKSHKSNLIIYTINALNKNDIKTVFLDIPIQCRNIDKMEIP